MRPDTLHVGGTLYWVIRTRDPDTLILKDADATPTVAVRKNGASTGDSVTINKRSATTGLYDCSYNPAAEVEGDVFELEERVQVTGTTTAQAYYDSGFSVKIAAVERGTDSAALASGVNVTQLGGDTQSLTDLKDFADAGYDPSTNKVQGVVTTDAVASAGMLSLADEILKRNVSNVESTAGEHTLATVILAMLEWEISGSDLVIKRTDGSTVHYTKTLSSATGSGDVITGLN